MVVGRGDGIIFGGARSTSPFSFSIAAAYRSSAWMFHVSASVAPGHARRLREWLVAEWGEGAVFKSQSDGNITVPMPLLAVLGQQLLGGLVFSRFREPVGDACGLWINALFVAPEHRRKKIATQLIRAAETEALQAGEVQLFALTDIPQLYENVGWQRVYSSDKGIVLRAVLGNK